MRNLLKKAAALAICLCMVLSCISAAFAAGEDIAGDRKDISAETLLKGLTLEQKIGQMIMPAFRSWTDENGTVKVTKINEEIEAAINEYGFGGIILFAENTQGTAQTTELIGDMQAAAAASESGIPLLMAVDQEGGYIYRLGTGTDTCGNMALGAAGDPKLAKQAAGIIGCELAAEGFNVDFAPTMDVNNNPGNPVIGVRSYSDDPDLVATLGAAFITGLQEKNIAVSIKHFPGHGDTATDSHSGLPLIDKNLAELRQLELIPFKAGIDAGADMIMTAHIQYPQIEKTTYISKESGEEITLPATLSKTIITDILRSELGFEGVVVTDAMNMGAIVAHFDRMDAARFAINAGVDILLMPVEMSDPEGIADMGTYIEGIKRMVIAGEIPEKTIDSAVKRILELKIKKGLFDTAVFSNVGLALNTVGSKANHDAEWSITEKAITLVKNEGGTLPLKVADGGKAVLFCAYSNEVNSMNFALERLKNEGVISDKAEYSVLCYQNMDAVSEEYAEAIKDSDAVLVSAEATGAKTLKGGWQAAFIDDAIAVAHENGRKIAVISLQLPYDLARYQEADALLAAYSAKGMNVMPTEYNGEAVSYGPNLPVAVYTAFGGCIPSGKLPVNIPKLDSENNYTAETLYQRGYGITGNWNFIDIPAGAYYADAVDWAVANDITEGTGRAVFGPGVYCTRAQAVTFLMRASGTHEAGKTAAVFKDVNPDAYYIKAVEWALSNGITTGTSETAFSPELACTRAQIVTFLWRAAMCPEADSGAAVFEDVPASAYYKDAVAWALSEGITMGTAENTFGPDQVCTRAQVVTFLNRWLNK